MYLESERLIIRDYISSDWSRVHDYASDPEVTKHMLWGPNTVNDTHEFFKRVLIMQEQEHRTDYELAVLVKDTKKLIGGCSHHIEGINGEIGYCFNSAYWGNGYATEAAEAMLRIGFEKFDLHRIYATCRPDNRSSARVLEKIGMKREGHLREHIWSKGRYHDSWLHSILIHEYKV